MPRSTIQPVRSSTATFYIVVYGLDGMVLAHGANKSRIGTNQIDDKDADGKAFVKERVDLAKQNPSFWQSYKFMNPVTKKVEPKQMYCERLDETAVCGGIYQNLTKRERHTVTRFLRLFACAAASSPPRVPSGPRRKRRMPRLQRRNRRCAMVQSAVAFLKAQGPEKGYAAIDDKSGQFVQGDLYIAVVGLDGTLLAYGADGHRVGDNVMDLKDSDGKEVIKERVELAKKQPSFWQSYKFMNPVSKTVEPKQMYCERLNETVVCGGVYQ